MVINFVMSSYVESKIFNDIISYFRIYSKFRIIVTKNPIKNANSYYYFRPHLESKIKDHSIVTVHHDLEEDDQKLNLNLFLNRYKECKLIICLNSNQQKILKKYNIYNSLIIPHGYNKKLLYKKKKVKEKINIGFFSSFYPRGVKGENYMLNLFKKLPREKFHFTLVGKKRKVLAKELNLLGYECEVYENIPYRFFIKLYQKIDCLLIVSNFEGGPASLPESLATGTPVVTTKVGMANDFTNKEVIFLSKNSNNDRKIFLNFEENISKLNNNDIINKLITWQRVISLYDESFQNYSNSNPIKKIDIIIYKLYEIKYKTIIFIKYFFRKAYLFPFTLFNIIKLILKNE